MNRTPARFTQAEVAPSHSGCPLHDAIADCPLYIESHIGEGRGCIDTMNMECRVACGRMNYQRSIVELASMGRDHPGLLQLIQTVGGRQ